MKRSKSSSHKKTSKQIKCQTPRKPNNLKIEPFHTIENPSQTERLYSSRNTFEERLNNIRKGFEKLEENLNFNLSAEDQKKEKMEPLTSYLKPCKVAKKEFLSESSRKTIGKGKKKQKMSEFSPLRTVSREKHHACIYEKSLYDLMKIVVIQKEEISRLNKEVMKSSRTRK